MFGLGRNKRTPLSDHLERITVARAAEFMEAQREKVDTSKDFLEFLLLIQIQRCAGSFVQTVGRLAARRLGAATDAIAFEGLAFAYYATREMHLPTPDRPLNDEEPEVWLRRIGSQRAHSRWSLSSRAGRRGTYCTGG